MSRCGPWHYQGKKNRWRECRETHMTAEDRTWMLEHSEEESRPAEIARHRMNQIKARWVGRDRPPGHSGIIDWWEQDFEHEPLARWVEAYEPPHFPIVPPLAFTRPQQPEQYGISDDTNERARRLIESALGDDHA
jgi:hypothetical protein